MAESPLRTLGLEPDPFERMKSGQKTIEFRLNKPKWKDMVIEEVFRFAKVPDRAETLTVKILELIRFPSFLQLLEYLKQQGRLEAGRSVQEQLQRLETRYPKNERNKYPGVLGIRIKVISK